MWLWREFWCMISIAIVLGNGESRKKFDIATLKGHGKIYGCNAIYRDYPELCARIVSVNESMYQEVYEAKQKNQYKFELIGPKDISDWNFTFLGEKLRYKPNGLKGYRLFQRGKQSNPDHKIIDLATRKGSGTSAVLHAAERGYENICILGFDMIGKIKAKANDFTPWINNVYKNTRNYETRARQKSYLFYEWLFHLTQIFRRFPNTNFYLFNIKDNWDANLKYKQYFENSPGNVFCATYESVHKLLGGYKDHIDWTFKS